MPQKGAMLTGVCLSLLCTDYGARICLRHERSVMHRAKIVAIGVISLLTLIVFLQNTQAVETRFLFLTLTMPRVLLLFVTFVLGLVGGLIIASYVLRKPAKSEKHS